MSALDGDVLEKRLREARHDDGFPLLTHALAAAPYENAGL